MPRLVDACWNSPVLEWEHSVALRGQSGNKWLSERVRAAHSGRNLGAFAYKLGAPCSESRLPVPSYLRREISIQQDGNNRTRTGETGKTIDLLASKPQANGSSHLSKLVDEAPKFKSAQVRRQWPEIKAALREGHKLKRIWECLNADGVQLSYAKLRWYVAKLKRAESDGVEFPKAGTLARKPSDWDSPKRDVLANLRERMNRRPGFEFDESPPDPKKLV